MHPHAGVDGTLVGTHVGGAQAAPRFAYELLSRNDEETRRILEETVLLLLPCLNPDGRIMVTDWYRRWVGTEYEGTGLPWLVGRPGRKLRHDGTLSHCLGARIIVLITGMSDTILPSGRFVIRIDPRLHALLRDAARRSGVSLNEYCARKLALPDTLTKPAVDVVSRAGSLFGEALVGVLAFGSWARDELAEGSDVDVLVVLEPRVAITRELYRKWDSEPIDWDTHPIEAHFLNLPDFGARVSGVWAEAAVDGVLLFDRDLSLSRRLVEIRRRIVAGEIIRRRAHGQPYWVEAA